MNGSLLERPYITLDLYNSSSTNRQLAIIINKLETSTRYLPLFDVLKANVTLTAAKSTTITLNRSNFDTSFLNNLYSSVNNAFPELTSKTFIMNFHFYTTAATSANVKGGPSIFTQPVILYILSTNEASVDVPFIHQCLANFNVIWNMKTASKVEINVQPKVNCTFGRVSACGTLINYQPDALNN